LLAVPRENFVGAGPWKIASVDVGLGGTRYTDTRGADPEHLYHDLPVALDPARDLINGQPAALAKWIDALNLLRGYRIYHLGCGFGYYTTIMAEVVGLDGRVTASEIDAELAARARANLAAHSNVSVHAGDGPTSILASAMRSRSMQESFTLIRNGLPVCGRVVA